MLSESRVGNFTSSEIYKLMSMGKIEMTEEELKARPKSGVGSKVKYKEGGLGESALTYIEECKMEREFDRRLDVDSYSRPTSWGTLVEKRAFDLLDTDYILVSDKTLRHPEFNFWLGSPDVIKHDTVGDIKCPSSLKSFYNLVKSKDIYEIIEKHEDGEKYYWQLVSNSILTNTKFAELIVYMPFRSELDIIRELASNYDGNQNKFAWINWASDYELPFIKDGGKFNNINVIRFEVKESEKDRLIERVKESGEKLKE